MSKKFQLGLVQLSVGGDKGHNIARAISFVQEASKKGANVVALPECWNSPYGTDYFSEYAEKIDNSKNTESPSVTAMQRMAIENSVYLIGGSIPEKEGDRLYNTSCVFNPEGKLIAKHRKLHLYDLDIPGKIKFQESSTLSAGNKLTVFDTPYGKFGLGICYDIRFVEYASVLTAKGCQILCYPGAFNKTTGEAHWELLQRGRAVDNQVYVCTISPARHSPKENPSPSSYVAWGHSMVVNPWGTTIAKAEEEEKIIIADIDLSKVEEIRKNIPILTQKRKDVYSLPTEL
ncbi:hypothetical protein Zmor_003944 [Zophobas morio]|uniref:omega-amidase n=1 Tax=Zophobas morio TaxID=2755281 RepID=A0AA38HKD4_9CUCU|nr:hypothetical protein Zmor_003944 [Zophobas morio]